ncbi:MAG: terminase [Actinomycetota bacterium]
MTSTRAPAGLRGPGKRLWTSVLDEFDLAEHERAQLAEACFVRDRIDQLRARVDTDGLMIESSQGSRLHPGVAEIRSQQLALARLLATLSVPALVEDALPPSRGVRGVYSLTGRAS